MKQPLLPGRAVRYGVLLSLLGAVCSGCSWQGSSESAPPHEQLVLIQDTALATGSHGYALLLTVERLSPPPSDTAPQRFRLVVEGPLSELGLLKTADDIIMGTEARWREDARVRLPTELPFLGSCVPFSQAVSEADMTRAVPSPDDPSILMVTPAALPDDELPCFGAEVAALRLSAE